MDKKTKKVQEYYESYPYPSRPYLKKKNLPEYVNWACKQTGLSASDFKGKKVLDAGCGTGELSNSLSNVGAIVTGIDLSKTSISKARKTAKNNSQKINFLQMDIMNLKLKEKYDFIFSFGVLHHTINPKKGFFDLSKLLNKDGFIAIGLYHKKGRFKQRVKRLIVQAFAIFGFNLQRKIIQLIYGKKQLTKRNENYIYDKFLVPVESYHTKTQVKKWFKENNLKVLGEATPQKSFFIIYGKQAKSLNI